MYYQKGILKFMIDLETQTIFGIQKELFLPKKK
jgi:hypothetical protein